MIKAARITLAIISFVVIFLIVLMAMSNSATARSYEAFDCEDTTIQLVPAKYFKPNCAYSVCDSKGHAVDAITGRLVDRWTRVKGDTLFYKGRACQAWDEEDYN